MDSPLFDYLIIGGGISGLQSLDVLSSVTSNIILLESQKYLGGRVLSQNVASLKGASSYQWVKDRQNALNEVYIEKGATWIEERHVCILQLCRRFNIGLREQHSEGKNLYLHQNLSLDNQTLDLDPRFGLRLRNFVDQIDHLSTLYEKQVLSGKQTSRASRMLTNYDSKTITQYLQETVSSPECRDFIDNFLEHTECVSCDENSMHEVLTKNARSNDVGILKQFLGDYGHEASYIVDGGSSLLIQKFILQIQKTTKLKREKLIQLNHQVISINNKRSDFVIVTSLNLLTNQITSHKAKKVICTVPLAISRSITFTNISTAKRLIIDNQLRTSCAKSFLVVRQPFWRSFATGDGMFSGEHLANMCHDISPTDLSCGILVFFHSGKKYAEWESKFKAQVDEFEAKKQYIIDLACKIFRFTEQQKNEYFHDALFYASTFMNNPHIRSGFQSNTAPGTFSTIVRQGEGIDAFYRDQNNLVFVGSEYSTEFASYMEGAIRVARAKCYELIGQKDTLLEHKKQNEQKKCDIE